MAGTQETKRIACRYRRACAERAARLNQVERVEQMDTGKRQLLQKALAKVETDKPDTHAFIAVTTPAGKRILLRPDFVCYETYVEGTDPDGQLLTLTYEQIDTVEVETMQTGH
jgi:hypothetical protein